MRRFSGKQRRKRRWKMDDYLVFEILDHPRFWPLVDKLKREKKEKEKENENLNTIKSNNSYEKNES